MSQEEQEEEQPNPSLDHAATRLVKRSRHFLDHGVPKKRPESLSQKVQEPRQDTDCDENILPTKIVYNERTCLSDTTFSALSLALAKAAEAAVTSPS